MIQKIICTIVFFLVLTSAVTMGIPTAHAQTATDTPTATVAATDSTGATVTTTSTTTATTLPNTAGANPTLLTVGLGAIMVLIGSYSFFILKKK